MLGSTMLPRLRHAAICVLCATIVAGCWALARPELSPASPLSGLVTTTSPLVIDPSGSSSTDALSVSQGPTVEYVQRMPVTKVIDQVTLGDFRSTCGGSATLFVREHNPDTGDQDQITYSPSAVAWPSSSGRVTWSIPPTRLVAGRGYAFAVSGSGCVEQTSWAHDGSKVNGGWRRCTDFARPDEQATINEFGMWRVWHEHGQSDQLAPCSQSSPSWYADIPSGWLASQSGSILYGSFVDKPTPQQLCDPNGSGYNPSAGAEVVEAEDNPGSPGQAWYVCVWPQYGPMNEQVDNGWHYGLPWRASGVKGVPREMYLKLRATTQGAVESALRGVGGTSYQAAPNLPRCMKADPVNCATGNFSEVYADVAAGGRGVGLGLTRSYNSIAAAAGETGAFGYGWSFSFGESLSVASGGDVTVRHDDGSTATFTPIGDGKYAAAGWVQSELVKRSDGSYAYTLPDQRVMSFTSSGRLDWVEDRNANRTTLAYSSGQLSTITAPGGRSIALEHNGDGTISQATDPVGHEVHYSYTSGQLTSVEDVGGGTTSFGYDASHRMTSVTDARGKQTTNVYDSQNRVTEQTDPLNHTSQWDWSTAGQTKFTDSTGRVIVQHFDHNLPSSETKGVGTASEATWTYGYDEDGNRTSVTDPNNHEWSSSFDEHGNRTASTDPLNHTTHWTYDDDRNVTSTTTPAGRETRFEYDANGNLTAIERTRTETSQTVRTTLDYDSHGQLISSTDPLNRETTFAYNADGDRISTTTPRGKTTSATYDDLGRVVTETSARGHETGADPDDFTTHITRDEFGQPTDVEDPLGHHTLMDYDADQNLVSVTDRAGKQTTYDYDDAGRQTQVTRPDDSTLGTGYDAMGRVTSQTDGLDHSTTYAYDGQGRAKSSTDPLNRTTEQAYDDAGNLTMITDPQSRTTSMGYDDADRLTGVSYSSGHPGDVTITYTTDGERNTVEDDSGTADYDYDSLGRLSSHTNGAGQTTAYHYDLAGQVSSLDYPDALTLRDTSTSNPSTHVTTGTVDRDYDDDGNLTSVTDWLSHETTFDYDAEGHLTGVDRPNGTSASYQYDRVGALSDLTDRGDHTGLGRTADSLLASSTPPVGSAKNYGYDDVRRLTGAGSASYGYDDADNLTQTVGYGGTAVAQHFDAANQLTSTSEAASTTATFDYNAEGDRTARDDAAGADSAYGYDQAGQLTSYDGPNRADAGTTTEAYGYDADGLRQTKTSDGQERTFAYDVSGGLPTIVTDGPTAYLTGPGGLPIEQITQAGTVRYFHHDQLGSTTGLSNQSGSTVASYDYDAYGNPVGAPSSVENPFGYAGQYTDASSGLQYLRARYYDPATSQFISRDPLEGATRQPYAYADNAPTNYTDPSGAGIGDIGMFISNASAGALDFASGGLSTKLAGKIVGFDPDCAEWGPGFGTGQFLAAGTAAFGLAEAGVRGAAWLASRRAARSAGRLPWTAWENYQQVTVGGREYAQVGDRLYAKHAIERTMPRGLTTNGRSISPSNIEDVIQNGTRSDVTVEGVPRQVYRSGTVEVVTEQEGRTVVTVNPYKYAN
jgi:RHS repeat-associated protein